MLSEQVQPGVDKAAARRWDGTQYRPLRVLQITPRYHPLIGGVESHVAQVAGRMGRAGAEVTVLTTDPWGRWAQRERIDDVTIRRVRAWPANRDYYLAPGLLGEVQPGAWDIVHVQSYHTLVAPLAMLAAWRARLPYVVTFHAGGHSSKLRNASRGTQKAMLRPLLARAARLVALTEDKADQLSAELHLPRERFAVIANGADLPALPAGAAPAPAPGLIASVGRLERYKGHQRLIAALPEILRQAPEAHVWIAGVGAYEPELRRLAHTLGVADRVEIRAIPPSERQRMAQELSQAAVAVLLSEYETQPIAALEALALSRPLLVADAPGLRELAQRGWTRMIALDSPPAAVAAAVVRELRDPLIPHHLDLPTWEHCASALLSLYQAVLH